MAECSPGKLKGVCLIIVGMTNKTFIFDIRKDFDVNIRTSSDIGMTLFSPAYFCPISE